MTSSSTILPTTSTQVMLAVRNRAAFAEKMFDHSSQDRGGVFVAGELDVRLGDVVELELHFVEEGVRFRLRAQVLWKRPSQGKLGLEGGTGLGFVASAQNSKERLFAFVDGRDVYHRPRETRRYPMHVDVRVDAGQGMMSCVTDDLSDGGCFVLMAQPPPLGTKVRIKLRSEGSLFGWMSLDATTAWHRFDAMNTGAGFEFRIDDSRKKKLERLLVVLKERELRVITPRPAKH
jgi:Tfp pilus assembly protein PilZ